MSDSRTSIKKLVFLFGKVAFVILVAFGAIVACVAYLNWSAERKANAFCDDIAVGTDISLAIEKAKEKKIFYSDYPPYASYFFLGMVFDKAVYEVSVDPNRNVTSKHSEMEYDQ